MARQISIIGDSISTYEGYNPPGYAVYYKEDIVYDNEIESVNDTWWKKVIDGLCGELCVNNSYSGSLVSGIYDSSACSAVRCSSMHGEISPDIILIYIGTNDRGYNIEIGLDAPYDIKKFYGVYRTMLKQLKSNYPSAKIVCGTLLWGKLKGFADQIVKADSQYNEAIKLAVNVEGCLLADLALFDERYETLDYCHPTKSGHELMAKLWLKCLNSIDLQL